ncbi:hypothetical protein L3X38_013363 [Prunus dulcis]|uniref:Uncharacterized protein n=1 Tax=Prunus dulcis TaxID=3755 RepID=A0AAD4ZH96_PRUDU|nr:hypothetical protein L3X38_013363 [Prunus dulcis]
MATQVLVLGTSSWRELSSIPPSCLTYKSTYAHGDMHWLVIEDDNILSFDFKKEEFNWTPCLASLAASLGLSPLA